MMLSVHRRRESQRNTRVKERTKLNNKGLTLVEIIISITILALVVVPTLRALTTAMMYNQKARTRQSVTASVETLMETFKGYGISDINDMFPMAGGVDPMVDIPGITLDPTGSKYRDPSSPNKYFIKNMLVENRRYDVDITATPNTAYSRNLLDLETIDTSKDAVFWDQPVSSRDVYSEIVNDFNTNHITDFVTAINSAGVRTIDDADFTETDIDVTKLRIKGRTIDVETVMSGSDYQVSVTMTYSYNFLKYDCYKKVGTDLIPKELSAADIEAIFSDKTYVVNYPNFFSAPTLERLYMFYYPYYMYEDGVGSGSTLDKINFTGPVPSEIYLVKQNPLNLTETSRGIEDGRYRVNITNASGSPTIYNNYLTGQASTTCTIESLTKEISGKETIYDIAIDVYLSDDAARTNKIAELTGTMIEK